MDEIDIAMRAFKLAIINLEPVINDKDEATYKTMLQVMKASMQVVNSIAEKYQERDKCN